MRVRRQLGISLLAAVAVALLAAASAAASPGGASLSAGQARRAIHRATRLLRAPRRVHAGHSRARPAELTTTMLALARSLPDLPPLQRRRAKALLARPTDSPDPDGNSYTVPEATPFCSAHFCVHYVASTRDAPSLTDGNGNGVPDYVELVASIAEQVYSVENGTLGWQPPRPDGTRGGDSRTDIYLVQLGGQLFGYSAPDAGQLGRQQSAYLVVDNDYVPAEFPGTTPTGDLQVTLAHEYNHVLQFGYDVDQDLWFYEASAVWMEDHVFPSNNDYLRYVRRWVDRSRLPITQNNIKIYGSAVWNHWLAGRYGDAIVRNAWERAAAVRPSGFAVATYDSAIRAAGGPGFAQEFARFAAATAEWRTPGDFPYVDAPLWQDVKRAGTLRPGHFLAPRLNHTGFVLLRVPRVHARTLRLLAGGQRGTESAFALICRQGPVATGRVRIRMRFARQGGIRGITLRRPGRCSRITAALINADARQQGFAFGDWLYGHDHERFAATLLARS